MKVCAFIILASLLTATAAALIHARAEPATAGIIDILTDKLTDVTEKIPGISKLLGKKEEED
jgi:hypothetical protein